MASLALPNDPIVYWNGPSGERWAQHQERFDGALAPFAQALFDTAKVAPGEAILDVGCGAGYTTAKAAERVGPQGKVVGLDVSRVLLERARARTAALEAVEFVEADGETASLGRTFDAIVSRFGVMFFRDPARAFRRLFDHLRPGGRIAWVVWRDPKWNPWMHRTMEVAAPFLAPEPPTDPYAPGPFALSDAARNESLLKTAGFVDVHHTPFDTSYVFSTRGLDDAVEFALVAGPISRRLEGVDAKVVAQVREALRNLLSTASGPSGVAMPASTWCVTATRPLS